jgi:hypothetical protein
MKVFFDTDVLIWHLRGDKRALHFFKELSARQPSAEWYTGALNRAEIVFFMKPVETNNTLLFLTRFETAPVDEDVVDTASVLYRKWSPSCGMDINDAVLAATVEREGGLLYTLNTKHYPMNTFFVEKAF